MSDKLTSEASAARGLAPVTADARGLDGNSSRSVIEAITVTLYRVANRPKGWRKGKPRRQKALAYRDAAWAKIRTHCKCTFPVAEDDPPRVLCRYHDKEHRTPTLPHRDCWGYVDGGPEEPGFFEPPAIWRLPRADEPGLWDYGRAVAFRLARFYRHCDSRPNAVRDAHALSPSDTGSER